MPASAGFKTGWPLNECYAAPRQRARDLAGWGGKRPKMLMEYGFPDMAKDLAGCAISCAWDL